jgi:hypothetical protein
MRSRAKLAMKTLGGFSKTGALWKIRDEYGQRYQRLCIKLQKLRSMQKQLKDLSC